jgi:EAL domain-containing protein (putative c-di-GMP-specific phosphodiesterase class I)
VILQPQVSGEESVIELARKLINVLRESFRVHEHTLYMTPSIGVSLYPGHGDTPQALITHADAAMYQAKQEGRNDFRVFSPGLNSFFPERLSLEQDMRQALARQDFVLHYQPKFDVRTGAVVGMEALLRWNHPEKGFIPPDQFIPIAEESGLIVPLGRWVLETACAQNKRWQDEGMSRVRVAVNLSAVQFRQRDLVETIRNVLQHTGLGPESLELEITETVVMQNASDAVGTIEALSGMGIQVAIDDFGTGYSSLSYLKRFQLNKLKIDRSFIRDIASDQDDAAIVKATIGLAHNLRLKVIAEGVETEDQLLYLRSLGCDEYQGYYKSKAISASEFERKFVAKAQTPEESARASAGEVVSAAT